jgi:chloramphenicol-sensitive protein RarD
VLAVNGTGGFTRLGADHAALLASAGIVTAVPLLAFAGSAARIPLSRLGLLQFMTPTIQFLIGVLLRHEPLPTSRLVGFVLVWIALAMFTFDTATNHRRQLSFATEAIT